jgi:segregation and condensation protein A
MQSLFAREAPTTVPTWTVHTDVFEGPLDLLLYLVKRDGVDLTNLPVADIADAYLEFVERMRGLNLSLAGDYLVMAATLIHLKSLELLPRLPTPVEDDEPDPREVFAKRLSDYQRYRAAAQALDDRPRLGRDQFARPDQEAGAAPLTTAFDVFGLLDIYRDLTRRAAEPEPEVSFEQRPHLDMGEAALSVLAFLEAHGGHGDLATLLRGIPTRAGQVITFIGVLEMLKLGWVTATQRHHLGPVTLEAQVLVREADLGALRGWVEEDTA